MTPPRKVTMAQLESGTVPVFELRLGIHSVIALWALTGHHRRQHVRPGEDCLVDEQVVKLEQAVGAIMDTAVERDVLERIVQELAACEVCGCRHHRPCARGCAWSDTYLLVDRFVCTRCEQGGVRLAAPPSRLVLPGDPGFARGH